MELHWVTMPNTRKYDPQKCPFPCGESETPTSPGAHEYRLHILNGILISSAISAQLTVLTLPSVL